MCVMIDTLTAELLCPNGDGLDTARYLDTANERFEKESGRETFRGFTGGLEISGDAYRIWIRKGSLSKYLLGNNFENMNRFEAWDAVQMISDAIHKDMTPAQIRRLDFGGTMVMNSPPSEYLATFGNFPRYRRFDVSKGQTLQTITYKTAAVEIVTYDKGKEAGRATPEKYQGANALRCELRILKGITKRMNRPRPCVLGDLSDERFCNDLAGLWLQNLHKINKLDANKIETGIIMGERNLTEAEIKNLGLLLLVKTHGLKLFEASLKDKEQLRRARISLAAAKKCEERLIRSDRSDLITELNQKATELATEWMQ